MFLPITFAARKLDPFAPLLNSRSSGKDLAHLKDFLDIFFGEFKVNATNALPTLGHDLKQMLSETQSPKHLPAQ